MVKVGPSFSDFVSTKDISKKIHGVSIPRTGLRDVFPLIALIAVFSIIFSKLFYVQIVQGEYYKELAEGNRIKTETVKAQRGIIFDRNKNPLVRNVPAFKTIVNGSTVFLNKDQALSLIAKGQEQHMETTVQREYLYKDVFSHVVGYIGEISEDELKNPSFRNYTMGSFVGKMGIERKYESRLQGSDGKELYEVDSKGNIIRFLGRKEPIAGQDVITSLDNNIQLATDHALSKIEKGVVIVSDPRDGSILAMLSKPSFDPNLFTHQDHYLGESSYKSVSEVLQDFEHQPLINRAISGTYPPGSTFKLITAISALSFGVITPSTKIEDTGVITVNNFSFGNWYYLSYGKKEGLLDVAGALKRSNDIFFYKMAELAGVEKIKKTSQQFGLGSALGIDLPGEESGLIPDPSWKQKAIGEDWYLGDSYHLGIGQGYLLVTPLQVNFWTSVFANRGTLFKPHIIQQDREEVIRENVAQKEYLDVVSEGMRQSCEEGGVAWPLFNFKVKPFDSAQGKDRELKIDGKDFIDEVATDGAHLARVTIACKTGTAETSQDKNPHAWITLFAPFYKPEIVVTVLVENGGEGSTVAAPIAKEILEEYFKNK